MNIGTVRLAPVTNSRLQWRTRPVFSTSGPDHDPGRVAQHEERDVEGVAQLHEAGRLVGAVAVDGAGEVVRVVGDHADRPALDAEQRGDHAEPEAAAQLEHRAGVGEAAR